MESSVLMAGRVRKELCGRWAGIGWGGGWAGAGVGAGAAMGWLVEESRA